MTWLLRCDTCGTTTVAPIVGDPAAPHEWVDLIGGPCHYCPACADIAVNVTQ